MAATKSDFLPPFLPASSPSASEALANFARLEHLYPNNLGALLQVRRPRRVGLLFFKKHDVLRAVCRLRWRGGKTAFVEKAVGRGWLATCGPCRY